MKPRIKELLDRPFNDLSEADKSEIANDQREFANAVSELCKSFGWQYAAVLEQSPHAISAGLRIIPLVEPSAPETQA